MTGCLGLYPIWDASEMRNDGELDLPMLKGAVSTFNGCGQTA